MVSSKDIKSSIDLLKTINDLISHIKSKIFDNSTMTSDVLGKSK